MKPVIHKIHGFTLSVWLVAAYAFIGAAKAHASWEAEWQKTLEAAKKEGQVRIYTTSSQNNLLIESGAFQKRFPEIKTVVTFGDVVPRIMAERRAGKYLADIAFTGPSSLWRLYLAKVFDPIRDAIILPEVADESKWLGGRHEYTDPERKYIFITAANPNAGYFYYNTELVNPKQFRSFRDFLRPEWRGKIAVRDVRTSGPGIDAIRFFYQHSELGPEFLRSFFGNAGITLFRDRRQGVDWLATGKYPLCAFCNSVLIEMAKLQGLPVDTFGSMKEGGWVTASGGGISLVERAPHPNAARVFINWVLSREGQLATQSLKGAATNSRRIDIPKDMVPEILLLQEGVEYLNVDTGELISKVPAIQDIIVQALTEAEKRSGK